MLPLNTSHFLNSFIQPDKISSDLKKNITEKSVEVNCFL